MKIRINFAESQITLDSAIRVKIRIIFAEYCNLFKLYLNFYAIMRHFIKGVFGYEKDEKVDNFRLCAVFANFRTIRRICIHFTQTP
ncbi:hypothetical protein ACWIUD_05920 [Helicobacter sp. 23-1044]